MVDVPWTTHGFPSVQFASGRTDCVNICMVIYSQLYFLVDQELIVPYSGILLLLSWHISIKLTIRKPGVTSSVILCLQRSQQFMCVTTGAPSPSCLTHALGQKETFLIILFLSYRWFEEPPSGMFLVFQGSGEEKTTLVDLEATGNSLLESDEYDLIHPRTLVHN